MAKVSARTTRRVFLGREPESARRDSGHCRGLDHQEKGNVPRGSVWNSALRSVAPQCQPSHAHAGSGSGDWRLTGSTLRAVRPEHAAARRGTVCARVSGVHRDLVSETLVAHFPARSRRLVWARTHCWYECQQSLLLEVVEPFALLPDRRRRQTPRAVSRGGGFSASKARVAFGPVESWVSRTT